MAFQRNYENLDATVVIGSMAMVTGLGAGLIFVRDIPTEVLPILASLVTAIFGLPLSYGAFRWGNNVGSKLAAENAAETNKTQGLALAQIAGAGPPPPAQPLGTDPAQPEGPAK